MHADGGRPLRDSLPLRAGLRAELPKAAADLARGVRERTERGVDVDGRRFIAKMSGEPSNLHDSGMMVASFRPIVVRPQGFILGVRDRRARARARLHVDGVGRLPMRQWIGVDADQVEQFTERIVASQIPADGDRS